MTLSATVIFKVLLGYATYKQLWCQILFRPSVWDFEGILILQYIFFILLDIILTVKSNRKNYENRVYGLFVVYLKLNILP